MKKNKAILVISIILLQITLHAQNWSWENVAGSSGYDEAKDVRQDASKNVYVTGDFSGTVAFDATHTLSSKGGSDIYIAKYSYAGNLLWVKNAGGAGDDYSKGIALDNNGNAFITGSFYKQAIFQDNTVLTAAASDAFIAKYSTMGELSWAKSAGFNVSGSGNDIIVDANGNAFVTGGGEVVEKLGGFLNLFYDPGKFAFVFSYNASGGKLWQYNYFDKDATKQNIAEGFSIDTDLNGYVYSLGRISGPTSLFYPSASFLVKLNSSGNLINEKIIASGGDPDDDAFIEPSVVKVDKKTGNLVVAGAASPVAVYAKIYLGETAIEYDSGIFFANFSAATLSLIKYDFIGGSGIDIYSAAKPKDLQIDLFGNIYLTGQFRKPISFISKGVNKLSANFSSAGGADIFIAKYNSDLNLLWAKHEGGIGDDFSNAVSAIHSNNGTLSGEDNIVIAGSFSNSINFPKPNNIGINTYSSKGATDILLAKLSNAISNHLNFNFRTSEAELNISEETIIRISPNPASDRIFINAGNSNSGIELTIRTFTGQLVQNFSGVLHGNTQEISVSSLPDGIYLMEIKSGDTVRTERFIIAK